MGGGGGGRGGRSISVVFKDVYKRMQQNALCGSALLFVILVLFDCLVIVLELAGCEMNRL